MISIALFMLGMWWVGWLGPAALAARFGKLDPALLQGDTDLKRASLAMTMIAGVLMAPWVAVIAAQMKRIEGRYSPLAHTQPRWLGYYNIWVAVLFAPASLIYFFKTGPLAWNGLISFWIPLTNFGVWFLVMFPMLRRAILSQAAEDGTTPAQSAPAIAQAG